MPHLRRYINRFPPATQVNFQRAVDTWQVRQVLSALEAAEPHPDGSTTKPDLLDISPPYLQLLFARHDGVGVLRDPEIQDRLKEAILKDDVSSVRKNKKLAHLGLCPGYISLLADQVFDKEDAVVRRQIRAWAAEVIRGCAARPVRLEEWTELGMDTIWTGLMDLQGITQKVPGKTDPLLTIGEDESRSSSLYRWCAVLVLLESNCLGPDVLEKSVLKPGKGNLVVTIAGSFGSADPGKSTLPLCSSPYQLAKRD